MAIFLSGLLIFFGAHLFTALARGARARLVERLGKGPYMGLYSLVSLAGLAAIIIGWPSAPTTVLYAPPAILRSVTILLMPLALIFTVAAYLPAGKIAGFAKHPMILGLKIWAFAHLLSNGDLRSVILFGAFLAFGVIDRIAVKRRGDMGRPAGPLTNDILPVVIGLAAYVVVVLWAHPYISGGMKVVP